MSTLTSVLLPIEVIMINSPGTVSGKVSFCIVCIAFSAFRARYHLEQKQENNGEDKDNVQDTLVFGTGAVEKKKIIGDCPNGGNEHEKACEDLLLAKHRLIHVVSSS